MDIPKILTSKVIEHLPNNFSGIDSKEKALGWLVDMISESNLYVVNEISTNETVGFIFLYIN